jgi:iron complex outermembrane receptor protein
MRRATFCVVGSFRTLGQQPACGPRSDSRTGAGSFSNRRSFVSRALIRTVCVLVLVVPTLAGWADDTNAAVSPPAEETEPAESEPADKPVLESEIMVTAPRIEIPLQENPAATTVVGEAELSAMPRAVAADEALKLVPGVKVDNQTNGEKVHLSIRGQGLLTERGIRGVKVLLDGLPLNDPSGFVPDLYDVDWATVDRVEVLRGPASVLYGGGASGGILNISTSDGAVAPVAGQVRLEAGSNAFWKVLGEAGGTTGGGLNYRVSASTASGDGYRDHSAFGATNLYTKLGLYDGPCGRVTVIVAGTHYDTQNPEGLNLDQVAEDPTLANPDAEVFDEYQDTRRGTVGVVSQWRLADNQSLLVTGYFRHTEWQESVPSTVQHRAYDSPGALLQYNLRGSLAGHANELSVGVDLDGQKIDEYRRPNLGGAQEGAEVVSDEEIHQSAWGLWAQDRLLLGYDLSMVLGVRRDDISNQLDDKLQSGGVDRSGDASFARTTTRVGMAWNPRGDFGLYTNWSTGFLPPATEELANNPENPGGFNRGLDAATSSGLEFGVRGNLAARLDYDVAVFHLDTQGDFGRYRIPDRPLETFYRNAGDSTRYGVETQLVWFPVDPLAVRLAYTYSHFTYDQVTVGSESFTDTWMPNAPENQAYLDFAGDLGRGVSAGAAVEWVSSWYVDPTNTAAVDGYTLLNARLVYQFHRASWSGAIMLSGRNLANEQYIAFTEPDPDGNSYQPGPGREGFLGVTLTF